MHIEIGPDQQGAGALSLQAQEQQRQAAFENQRRMFESMVRNIGKDNAALEFLPKVIAALKEHHEHAAGVSVYGAVRLPNGLLTPYTLATFEEKHGVATSHNRVCFSKKGEIIWDLPAD